MSTTTIDELRKVGGRPLSAADHPGLIRSFYPFWDTQYRPFLIEAIQAFPVDRLDFKPHPQMFTARQIVVHIAECENGWIRSVVEGAPMEDWVVPHEDPTQGWKLAVDAPDHAAMLKLLETWHRPTQAWLDRPVAEMSRIITRTLPDGSERRYTIHWILDHLQEHEIHHRAQLNLYLRLIGIGPPSI